MFGEGRSIRYFIGFGIVVVLLIFAIVLFARHGNNSGKVPETQKALTSYVDNNNITVNQTVIGPINAAQAHDQFKISVSNQSATIDVSRGYDNNIINSRSYPMTSDSFQEFLSALERAGFTKGNTDDTLKDDKGYCPTGERYIYTVMDGASTVERFWTTTCNTKKTYEGNFGLTQTLFRAQIPDYNQLVSGTDFSPSLLDL